MWYRFLGFKLGFLSGALLSFQGGTFPLGTLPHHVHYGTPQWLDAGVHAMVGRLGRPGLRRSKERLTAVRRPVRFVRRGFEAVPTRVDRMVSCELGVLIILDDVFLNCSVVLDKLHNYIIPLIYYQNCDNDKYLFDKCNLFHNSNVTAEQFGAPKDYAVPLSAAVSYFRLGWFRFVC